MPKFERTRSPDFIDTSDTNHFLSNAGPRAQELWWKQQEALTKEISDKIKQDLKPKDQKPNGPPDWRPTYKPRPPGNLGGGSGSQSSGKNSGGGSSMPRMTQPTVMNAPPPPSGGGGLLSGLMGLIGLATGQPYLGGVGALLEGNFEQGLTGIAQAFGTSDGDPNATTEQQQPGQEKQNPSAPADPQVEQPQPQQQIPLSGGVDPNSTSPAPQDPQVQQGAMTPPQITGFSSQQQISPAAWSMTQPGIHPQLLAMMTGPTFQPQGMTGFGGPYPNPFMM